jgi:hypothetical protein
MLLLMLRSGDLKVTEANRPAVVTYTHVVGYLRSLPVRQNSDSLDCAINIKIGCYFVSWLCSPARAMASSGSAAQRGLWPPRPTRFLDHTQRGATVGRTPLDE